MTFGRTFTSFVQFGIVTEDPYCSLQRGFKKRGSREARKADSCSV